MKKETHGEIRRDLKTRHLSMIAIGGSIGTGLFLASGNAIHTAGPGGALVAYIAIGIMVYFFNDKFRRNGYLHACIWFI